MKIGFIGSGLIGGDLALKFCKLGHSVRVSNSRGPDTLTELAAATGATASSIKEVLQSSEVIIIAVPQKAITTLPKELFAQLPSSTVVVDCGNYAPIRDGDIKDLDDGEADSSWVQRQLGFPVVKAFNGISIGSLRANARAAGDPERIALPVASDVPESKKLVLELIDSIGFDGFDAGSVADSWRQQPGTPSFAADYTLTGLPNALQRAVRSEVRIRFDVFMNKIYLGAGLDNTTIADVRKVADESFDQVMEAYNLLAQK